MAPLLPTVRVEKKQQPPPPPPPQQQQQEEARASSPFPAVLLVSLWGFLNAGFVTLGLVIFLVLSVINPCVPSWMLPTLDGPRDAAEVAAEDAKVTALLLGYMWCTVAQATAATPALLLLAAKRRRWMWIRRALACVVLAAAAASHCMFARVLTTGPGRDPIVFRITNSAAIFVFVVGDLLCLLALFVELWEATTRG